MKGLLASWFGFDNDEGALAPGPNQAAAALMIEVMAIDHEWHQLEIDRIQELMQISLGLTQEQAKQIVEEVADAHRGSHDLFQFTSVINSQYSQIDKYELLKNLWRVAYADGRVDAYEEHIIRRLADLIHMPHSQFIRSKIEVRGEC